MGVGTRDERALEDRGLDGRPLDDQALDDQALGEEAPAEEERGPERTCVVTRCKASPDTMVRFVVGPDAAVVPDIRQRLPGRGVWVSACEATVAAAVRKGAFARGFRAKVAVDPALATLVGDLLVRDALQSLAMANKAGAVTTGFAKVEAAISAGRVAAVLHASDASEDGVRKLDAAQRREGQRHAGAGRGDMLAPVIKLFASQQLDLALGRTNVIHASLAVGPAGHAFLKRCKRAMTYRPAPSLNSRVDALDSRADAKAASA